MFKGNNPELDLIDNLTTYDNKYDMENCHSKAESIEHNLLLARFVQNTKLNIKCHIGFLIKA